MLECWHQRTNERRWQVEPAVKMRINRRVFEQYYDVAKAEYGSTRAIAREVGVSNTLIHQILDRPNKTHVNLATAKRFERFFKAPANIVFMPEVFDVEANTTTRSAA